MQWAPCALTIQQLCSLSRISVMFSCLHCHCSKTQMFCPHKLRLPTLKGVTVGNLLVSLSRHWLQLIHEFDGYYSNKLVLLFFWMCLFIFWSCLDTMLKSTTTACLSWNRLLTRLLQASLAQSSLTCLKKLSTCWCIMTGKGISNISSLRRTHAPTHTNMNVYKLACWKKKKTLSFAHTPIFCFSNTHK